MKALVQDRYGEPDVLYLADIDVPEVSAGQVLVRVHAAGIDPGVWHLMTGLPYLVRPAFGLRRPKNRVRGLALAGRVEAVGPGVSGFTVGDAVYGVGDGTLAEFACAQADQLALAPTSISLDQAAAVPVSAVTALQALRDRGEVSAGQHVLIIGAGGGIGTYAVQLAKAFGAAVTAVCSTAKVDLVTEIGADDVIDYTREDISARGRQYDVVIDIAGRRRLSELRRVLTPRGTLVIVGGEGGGRWTGGFERMFLAMLRSPFVGQRLRGLVASDDAEDLQVLTGLIDGGQVRPVIGRTYPLTEAPEAIRHLAHGHAAGKIVVSI